jgi:Zn ribbon nucleic-acid-binding protein
MKCPKCSKPSEVVKVYQFPTEARRRRECLTCGHRFTTAEKLWRRIYAEEVKHRPAPRAGRQERAEPMKRRWSNFDVVPVDGYDMDYEDVSTYVHVSD